MNDAQTMASEDMKGGTEIQQKQHEGFLDTKEQEDECIEQEKPYEQYLELENEQFEEQEADKLQQEMGQYKVVENLWMANNVRTQPQSLLLEDEDIAVAIDAPKVLKDVPEDLQNAAGLYQEEIRKVRKAREIATCFGYDDESDSD